MGNPVRGNVTWALQGDRRARRDTEETRAEARVRCLVQPERRSPFASVFHSFLTGANTEPWGSFATREAPQSVSGGCCSGTRGLPIFPSPTSHSRAGATAAAHGRKDPEELAEAGGRGLQGAGREENPGVQAQATESQARSRSGAPEEVGAQERSTGWRWGCCRWGRNWRLGPGLGRD
ncbi:uncharacterized protein LOC110319777 [Mus pahari]|uniref:uncharacterized protein LOC110319777 n=1 Tax=Mus pahari TaxID=10093 RepID=UPI000A311E09|nr:uncharacterized protein LOC110319777 [Mus pahari]